MGSEEGGAGLGAHVPCPSRNGSGDGGNDSDGFLDLSVLLPVISAALLLLLLVASLFVWRMMRRQKKGECV